MKKIRQIFCCTCEKDVDAVLTNGEEIYPHRQDLWSLPFWKCSTCGNYVGCHYKTDEPTKPLGVIPSPKIRDIRKTIHGIIDPLWRSGKLKRSHVYARLNRILKKSFHTAEIRTVDEAYEALEAAYKLKGKLKS